MIKEIANLLDDFPGPANQTRCFAHVLNLVVKSIIKQFDLPKSKGDASLDDAAKELLALAGNIELEELIIYLASENSVRYERLDDYYTTSLVRNPGGTFAAPAYDATRCHYPLEFDIRHAGLRR
jgi:hypothetical protein